jgi:hypothetical protein
MSHYKPEENLILLMCAVNPFPEVVVQAKHLMTCKDCSLDYERMFRLAGANEVLSLLHHNLNKMNEAPDYVRQKLSNAYLHALKNNVVQSEEALKIFSLLSRNHIEAILLKGVVASEVIFGDPGLYLSSDIDILVRPGDLAQAGEVLLSAGYERDKGISENDLISSHYHFIFQKDGHHVEIHWNLVKRYYHIPPEFWWEDVHKTGYQGMEINELSAERYIMYTVFRLFDHGFRPLKFFVLISEIINKYQEEINWGELLAFAGRYKMQRLMSFTLRLIHDVLGTDIPYAVMKKKIIGYDALRKVIISGLFDEVTRPHLRMFLYTFLLDDPIEYAKVILRRFFPAMSEIRLRYGLPLGSKKVYAYYLLNPLLVLMKK